MTSKTINSTSSKNKVSPKDDNIQFFPFPFADVSYLCVSPQQQKAPN